MIIYRRLQRIYGWTKASFAVKSKVKGPLIDARMSHVYTENRPGCMLPGSLSLVLPPHDKQLPEADPLILPPHLRPFCHRRLDGPSNPYRTGF